MRKSKCCVGGCTSTSETHRLLHLPRNDKLRELWMTFLVKTNPDLASLTKYQLLYKKVCSKHFDKHQLGFYGERMQFTYPCLFSESEIALGEPRGSKTDWNVRVEHNYSEKPIDTPDLNIETAVSGETSEGQPTCSNAITSPVTNVLPNIPITVIKVKAVTNQDQQPCSYEHVANATTGEDNTISVIEETVFEDDIYHEESPCSDISKIESGSAKTDEGQPSSFATTADNVTTSLTKGKDTVKKKTIRKKTKLDKFLRMAGKGRNTPAQNLQHAQQVSGTSRIARNLNLLPKETRTFLEMQLNQADKKKLGRRFTLEEKLLAISIKKQNPTAYKLLEEMFTLPNKRTLGRVAENIQFEPGQNHHTFGHITKTIKNWDEKKKLCSILYAEVALTEPIPYDGNEEKTFGFVNINRQKKMTYCDHALIFMVRGICACWKQCIAYHLVQGNVSAAELKLILQDVVAQVAQTGLIPITLVSDQGSTFRTTIRNFRLDSILSRSLEGIRDDATIDIAGFQLNVVIDPPHLLKSLRNDFLTKDVIWGHKTASWQDIRHVYDIDKKLGSTRVLSTLTEYHMEPQKIRKNNVSVAAQVLSARTAAILKYTHAICKRSKSRCSTTMADTAEFVEFADKLFDSVNGYSGGSKPGKLRKAVKPDSAHAEFWNSAIEILKDMKFVDHSSKVVLESEQPSQILVPCLEGWMATLESFIRISQVLFEKYNVGFFYPRNINLDPLVKFF